MKVELLKSATKYIDKVDTKTYHRIINALIKLSNDPPLGDIKTLQGKDGYRLRVGDLRILFDIKDDTIIVHKVAPRGEAYK